MSNDALMLERGGIVGKVDMGAQLEQIGKRVEPA